MRMQLKSVPSGWYAHYMEMAQPMSDNLALILRSQNVDNVLGNYQYFIRYIDDTKQFDTMIPEVSFKLLSKAYSKNPAYWCEIYEYIYGKDTIKVYQDGKPGQYAIGPRENKEWQEDFSHYV